MGLRDKSIPCLFGRADEPCLRYLRDALDITLEAWQSFSLRRPDRTSLMAIEILQAPSVAARMTSDLSAFHQS